MDPLTIGAIISGAKTGLDVIKSAADTVSSIRAAAKGPEGQKTANVDVGKLSELADNLIVARVRTLDTLNLAEQLFSENQALRDQLARKEAFAERRQHYRLTRYEDGAVAFEYVQRTNDVTPPHMVCPMCFEDEKISHLQPDFIDYGSTKMKCGRCGTVVPVPNRYSFSAPTVSSDHNPFA